ncbi:hypothetical protein BDV06DRAFT_146411 [Aspergillus oleicola]
MITPFLDPSGNPIPEEQLLGYGRSGVVILQDKMAIKLPLRYSYTSDDEVTENTMVLRREQDVYNCLGKCEGVVPYISLLGESTQLAFMENGDLRSYLSRTKPPKSLQLAWFRQMAFALSCIHDRSVIVADIACRNILLDSDLSIKFCDFTESTIMPLGRVIYEVITGKDCGFDLHKNGVSRATLPRRETLPSTQGIWLGSIIEKCWIPGAYRNANDLKEELDAVSLEDPPSNYYLALVVGTAVVAIWLSFRWKRR